MVDLPQSYDNCLLNQYLRFVPGRQDFFCLSRWIALITTVGWNAHCSILYDEAASSLRHPIFSIFQAKFEINADLP